MGVGPALGNDVSVLAQKGGRLDEEPSETLAREQASRPGEHRSLGRPAAASDGGAGVGGPLARGAA